MKKQNLKNTVLVLLTVLFFQSCTEDGLLQNRNERSLLPDQFRVDIPESISNDDIFKSGKKSTGSVNYDTLSGNDIYGHLAHFIAIGEGASEIVEDIMMTIAIHQINRPMTLSYISDEDNRNKNLTVTEDQYFEGVPWSYKLVITDAESESNEDGGKAIEVLWNLDPIKGIAILKPYNINRNDLVANDAIFRIDYGETQEYGYDKWMIVSISGLPLLNPAVDPYSVDNLKMFAGRNGDIVDVYGNSNHPNAKFFDPEVQGFNWAFVASADENANIGVAEVGLPYSYVEATSREMILEEYSIKNVFEREITAVWGGWVSQEAMDAYLSNTAAPGYFTNEGFVTSGVAPSESYSEIESRIDVLTPYSPKSIMNLDVVFSE